MNCSAEIITIGDEILLGQIVDTNSAWIAQRLNEAGIGVRRMLSVFDRDLAIREALDSVRSQIVLITGGLGPTNDDITKKTLAAYFGATRFVLHEPTLEYIRQRFAHRGIVMNELNVKQAEVPDCCTVIFNTCGTAPGMLFERDGRIFISMPGVPSEMKTMLSEAIRIIRSKFNPSHIFHKTMMTYGIVESTLAATIAPVESELPAGVSLAYLPDIDTGVKLRLTAEIPDGALVIDSEFAKIRALLGDRFYGYEPDTLESVVGEHLLQNGETLAVAESCTGGRIASRITSLAGCSRWFCGGVVVYSNKAKEEILGVDTGTIERFGAVSRETVVQMAEGVRRKLHATYGLATTGIAGPDGGTDEKPVGLCWIAVATPHKTLAFSIKSMHDRKGNIASASSAALNALRKVLSSE
jgi:nicotinamide-nucleotide amidase